MKTTTLEDYDFEKAIEEFNRLNVGKPREAGADAGAASDAASKKDDKEKVVPVYDKDKFFDNLTLSTEVYDAGKRSASDNDSQPQGQSVPMRYSRSQLKDTLVETFGADTFASLYSYINNDQRDRNGPDYKPTVNFQKSYRGANPSFNRNRNLPVTYGKMLPDGHVMQLRPFNSRRNPSYY